MILDPRCSILDACQSVAEISYQRLQGDDREYWAIDIVGTYNCVHAGRKEKFSMRGARFV